MKPQRCWLVLKSGYDYQIAMKIEISCRFEEPSASQSTQNQANRTNLICVLLWIQSRLSQFP
jgi:hypothetical protein